MWLVSKRFFMSRFVRLEFLSGRTRLANCVERIRDGSSDPRMLGMLDGKLDFSGFKRKENTSSSIRRISIPLRCAGTNSSGRFCRVVRIRKHS